MCSNNIYEKKIERLQHIMDEIEPGKITILTGPNGSGKSLVRKQLCFRLAKKTPVERYEKLVAEISMQKRTELNPEMGGLSAMWHDASWEPTGCSTYYLIKSLFKTFLNKNSSKRYLIIDEPEIGMSKEAQMGLVNYIRSKLDDVLKYTYGLLIITHSDVIVEGLKDKSVFLNIEKDCTADEWLHRELIPMDLEVLEEESSNLFKAIEKYSREKKKKKE